MSALLSLRGVGKSYWRGDSEVRVLKDVSVDVRPGEFVAVWGTRGSGKTTLLKLAARLERPDRGMIYFNGADLANFSEAQHARLMLERIGWVRRTGPKSDLRMLDYVALPLLAEHGRRQAYARAGEALSEWRNRPCGPAVGKPLRRRARTDRHRPRRRTRAAATARRRPDREPRCARARARHRAVALACREEAIAVLMTVPDMPAAMRAHQIASLGGGRLARAAEPPGPDDEPGKVIHLHGRQQFA